ncbi:caspase family protein [Fortiea contorta]|uniref:nSTAND1 domain-containing NTPase n=1 Tax=Fortiea contorta TaxID=1892405 RepID=UPI000345C3A4|nr:caspase family protein [Fortiea contorta]
MARYALVVGIKDYESNSLNNLTKPATDAEAVKQVLEAHGDFEDIVLLKGKVSTTKLAKALKTLLQKQAVKNEALIYFTGHGITVSDSLGTQQAYLATSDFTRDNPIGGISLQSLNNLIAKSSLSSLVVLLDCCHSGDFLENNLLKTTLSAFNSESDYYFIAACRPFQEAYAKKSAQHSIFSTALLAGLSPENANKHGHVTSVDLFASISAELKGSGQQPIQLGWGSSITLVTYYQQKTVDQSSEEKNECPYQGLKAFEAEQKEFFFGRKQVVRDILAKLSEKPFVPIMGASGSGKSSVVRAGLIPELLNNRDWRVIEPIKPGFEPLEELRTAFKQCFTQANKQKQFQTLSNNYPNNLPEIIENLPGAEKFLLVVDQFEEVFTVCADKEARQKFIELLTQVVDITDSRLAVVITMRADFLEPCLQYPSLHQLIQTQAVFMGTLTEVNLKEIITKPAEKQKHSVEKALLVKICEDVKQEPGFLPLLEFALTKLWDKRDQKTRQLTLEEYEKLGGLTQALNLHAENVYNYQDFEKESPTQKRTQQEQEWIRLIFLSLLRTGEGEKDTRQRQVKEKLLDIAGSDPNQQQEFSELLDGEQGLVKGRLLVTGKDEQGEAWIDLAHEALIEGWQTFKEWRQQNPDLRRLSDRLADAQREWLKNSQDDNYLMQRGLLAEVRDSWAQLQLHTKEYTVFYHRSNAYEKYHLALAILSNVDNLTTSAEYANELALNIEAIEKSIEAGKLLKDPLLSDADETGEFLKDPLLSIADKVATQKMRVLIILNQLIYGFRERKIFTGHTDQVCGLSFSPDDQQLVSASADGSIRLWSLNSGELIQTINQQSLTVIDAIFNREGDLLISLIPRLRCETIQSWNFNESKIFIKSNTPFIPENVFPEENQVRNIAFSPDNKILAFDYARQIKLWNFNEKSIDLLDAQDRHNDNINRLDFSPSSAILASAGGDGFIKVWDINTKKLLKEWKEEGAIFSSVKFIDDKTIVFSDLNGKIIIGNFVDDNKQDLIDKQDRNQEAVNTLAVSRNPDCNFIASGSQDGYIKIWDCQNREYINGHKGSSLAITDVAFSNKNSQMLASAGADGIVKIWTIISPPIIDGWTFSFNPHNYQIVTGSQNDGSIKLWSENFTLKKTLDNPSNRVRVFKVKFSPDGGTIISTSLSIEDGQKKGIIEIWSSEGELMQTLPIMDKPPPASISFSPDSKTFIPVNRREKKVNICKLKDLVDGNPLYTFSTNEYVQDVSFSPDGKNIAVLVGKEIDIWNLTNEKENSAISLKTPDENEMVAMSFSPDGKFIAAAGITGTVYFWDLNQVTEQTKPRIFTKISKADNTVIDIVFSPGSEAVALAYNDKIAVILLNSKNAENSHVRILEQPQESICLHNRFTTDGEDDKTIQQIGFSTDGKFLAFSNSRNVVLWNFDFDELHKIYLENYRTR